MHAIHTRGPYFLMTATSTQTTRIVGVGGQSASRAGKPPVATGPQRSTVTRISDLPCRRTALPVPVSARVLAADAQEVLDERLQRVRHAFRAGALRIGLATGKPIAQVARDLGVNEGTWARIRGV